MQAAYFFENVGLIAYFQEEKHNDPLPAYKYTVPRPRRIRFSLFAVLSILLFRPLHAQDALPAPTVLIPVQSEGLWGYCDAQKTLRIAAAYAEAQPFHRDAAIVKVGRGYGLIDRYGRFILQPKYQAIHNGELLHLRKNGRWALASRQGKLLSDYIYSKLHPPVGGLLLAEAGEWRGMLDTAGLEVVAPEYDLLRVLRDEDGNATDMIACWKGPLIGLADRCGNLLRTPTYNRVDSYSDGFAVVQKEYRFGMIDLEGREVVPPRYENMHPVREGLAAAMVKGRWGFLDTEGREAIPFRYDAVHEEGFFQGRAAVLQDGEWVIIDRQGNKEMELQGPFRCIGRLSEGRAAACVLKTDGGIYYGYVDVDGRPIIDFKFDRAYSFYEGLAVVGKRVRSSNTLIGNTRFGVIDRDGRTVLPASLRSLSDTRLKRDSLARLGYTTWAQDGRNCRIDATGKVFDCAWPTLRGLQLRYRATRCEQQPLIAVSDGTYWGYCDQSARVVIPLKYDRVECFEDGLAKVWRGDAVFFVDTEGKEYRKLKPTK